MLGRVYIPELPVGTASDTLVLQLPGAMVPDQLGEVLSAVLAGGAFAAFLSTASGLTMSVAGVIDQVGDGVEGFAVGDAAVAFSAPGAAAEVLVVGGTLAAAAVVITIFAGPIPGWTGALLGQPAAWTIPLSFATAVIVSLATPGRIPRHTARTMVRLHTPEDLALDRE